VGRKDAARDIDLETSFHLDHGYGMDAYGVGPTLGCGAPALLDGERLILPWCYESYRILENGPLRFTVELAYQPVSIGHAAAEGQTTSVVTEHRLLSLDKGSNFNRMTVWYDGLQSPLALAAGVVLHGGMPILSRDFVLYADPTEAPDRHNSQVFVGSLFHNGVDRTRVLKSDGGVSHAIRVVDGYDGHPYTYYFGAAWSLYDVRSIEEWQLRATQFLQALEEPLSVTLQWPLRLSAIRMAFSPHASPSLSSFRLTMSETLAHEGRGEGAGRASAGLRPCLRTDRSCRAKKLFRSRRFAVGQLPLFHNKR
jgi:hypothetical protein